MTAIKIIQPAGIGDIIYCQKIAHSLCLHYGAVYWPLAPQLFYVPDYLNRANNLIYDDTGDKDCEILDLQSAHHHHVSGGIMEAKYAMAGIDGGNWQDYVRLQRNTRAELAIKTRSNPPQNYALACFNYATPPETFRATFTPQTKLPVFEITVLGGFTPFDWCQMIEGARELHFVDTVFTYLAEVLDTSGCEGNMYLYPRDRHVNKIVTKEVWKKPWKY